MAYIEENMKRRGGGVDDGDQEASEAPYDPHEELFRIDDRYKIQKRAVEEGNVTNSVAMLTAIPEVDLGMECVFFFHCFFAFDGYHSPRARLKNIEETEKAKRAVADERRKRNREQGLDSEVASSRCSSLLITNFHWLMYDILSLSSTSDSTIRRGCVEGCKTRSARSPC